MAQHINHILKATAFAFVILIAASFIAVSPTYADAEQVRVIKVTGSDHAIIERRNGEQYLIEKGIGCLSLDFFEGKNVLIVSPGLFAGIRSKLLITDRDQSCKIWNSEELSSGTAVQTHSSQTGIPPDSIFTIQKALKILGYDVGTIDGTLGDKTTKAFSNYQVKKGQTNLKMILMLMAVDISAKQSSIKEAGPLGKKLTEIALAIDQTSMSPSSTGAAGSTGGCETGHWIQRVVDSGDIVILEDNSIWKIDAVDRIDTALWLPITNITVCGDKLINTDDGESVGATKVK